jgi:hypothetical protein
VTTLLQYRSAIISHLSAITLFLGFHTLGLYVHNDVMQALVFATLARAYLGESIECLLVTGQAHHLDVVNGERVGEELPKSRTNQPSNESEMATNDP